jgi:hypothetical protein
MKSILNNPYRVISQKLVADIEHSVEATAQQRQANPSKANDFGNSLYASASVGFTLNELTSLLNRQRCKTINNAREMLFEVQPFLRNLKNFLGVRCEEQKKNLQENDYYDCYLQISTRIGSDALNLMFGEINRLIEIQDYATIMKKKGDALAVIEEIEKMDLKPEFKAHLKNNKEMLEGIELPPDPRVMEAIGALKSLLNKEGILMLNEAKPHLDILRYVLGCDSVIYLQVSTAIASKALGAWIDMVNTAQEEVNDADNKWRALRELKAAVELAWDEMKEIEQMDLLADFRERFRTNKSRLSDLKDQLRGVKPVRKSKVSIPWGTILAVMLFLLPALLWLLKWLMK